MEVPPTLRARGVLGFFLPVFFRAAVRFAASLRAARARAAPDDERLGDAVRGAELCSTALPMETLLALPLRDPALPARGFFTPTFRRLRLFLDLFFRRRGVATILL